MFRRMIPLAVAVVLVLGCKKKDEGGSGGGGGGSESGDPSATYTLKVREEQKGDKAQITRTESGTTTFTGQGKDGKETMSSKFEYTQEILDMPAGAAKPTKLTRAYKVAEKGSPPKALSFAGKTVFIENKGGVYTATVGGKELAGEEADEVLGSFNKPDGPTPAEMLPKKPVKLNESWTVEEAALKKLATSSQLPIDPSKSSITGKLTKAYTKDGKQWGVIEFRMQMTGSVEGKGPKSDLALTGDMTIETPIDASAHAGTKTTKGKVTITQGKGLSIVIDATEAETVTPIK
jgi:hypothetical protein